MHIIADKFIFHFRSEDKGGYAAVYPPIEAPPYNILTIENVTSVIEELTILEEDPLLHNQILMIGLSFTLPTVTSDSITIPTPTTSVFIYTTEETNLSLLENAIDHPTISDVTSYYVAPIHTKQHKTSNRKKEGGASYANAVMNRGTEQSITRGTTSSSSNDHKQQLTKMSKEIQALRSLIKTEATSAAIVAIAPMQQDLDRQKALTAKINARLTAESTRSTRIESTVASYTDMAQAATDKATATIKSLQATNEALKAEQAEQTEKLNQLFGIVNTNNKVEASNTALANATAAHIPQTLESGESKENNNMDIT
jgi:hypothetical protein